MQRKNFLILCIAVALIGSVLAWQYGTDTNRPATRQATSVAYTLTDHNGHRVTEKSFSDTYSLVFFGYTFCPDVCPTTLQDFAQIMDLLGNKADKLVPIFITFDPARDTTEVMKDFVENFHPSIMGLTGSSEDVMQAAKSFRVYYNKEITDPDDPENYLISHSTFIYLIEPGTNNLIKHFRYGDKPEHIAAELLKLL